MGRPELSELAVETKALSHRYAGSARAALDGLDLQVRRGEIFGLLGPNGGGKTTAFRILASSLAPSGGSASVLGIDVLGRPAELRRRIGVVFQNPGLDRKLTVQENLRYHGRLYGLAGSELQERIAQSLHRLRLGDRARELTETLSGGLRRRVELAKGLLHRPELLLLDEPSTGLDPGARKDLWAHLKELKEGGITVLLTTHLMEEAENCDRLAILDRGRLVASGTPEELKSSIGGEVVSIRTAEPARLCEEIRAKFGGDPAVVDDTIRIERREAHSFIPPLFESFPRQIDSITVGRPTLEDVFIHHTRHRFWNGDGA